MKNTLLLLSHCLLLTFSSFAQSEPPTYVFSISARQAEFLHQNPYDSLDVSALPAPIDSFWHSRKENERQPGHYLYVQPHLENLNIELRSYYAYQLNTRNNDRDLALELVDAAGRLRPDADIRLGKRKIPFDENTQTYRRRHWLRDGLLTVSIDQDTLFFELTGNITAPVFFRKIHYWRQSKVGYWLTTPIRWVENSYRYVKRGIRWGDWHLYTNPFRFLKRERGFRGYVAGTQPLYRPGDTLKIKAYLTNNKGKPWSGKVRMIMWAQNPQNYQRQYFIDSTLIPGEPGHFQFIQHLSDTLPLDYTYYLDFEHPRRDKFTGLQHHFQLEDYELDEATFTLDLLQDTYHRGEKIGLKAEGKDENDNLIAGAEIRLTLMVSKILDIYRNSLQVPDTLWIHRENLRDQEPTPIMIPDSIFQETDLDLKLIATFVHPSGELHQSEHTFTYRYEPDKLRLKLEGDSIIATLERNGQSRNGRAVLTRYGTQADELPIEADTIDLPYREAVSPYFEYYELAMDSLFSELDIWNGNESLVQVSGQWQPDTVLINFTNPRRLNITWLLQSQTKEIRRGSFTEAAGQVKVPVGNQAQWELAYQYFWSYPRSEELRIYKLEKQLKIKIEQPAKVSPGETVQVKVMVQDQKGQPAAGVQLAAAAVNAQFKNPGSAYKAPVIPYKTTRDPFTIENFRVEPLNIKPGDKYVKGLTSEWFRKLDLQGYPFYRLRYRNPGVWMQWDTLTQDTFYRKIAQVAPYLINQGKVIPIYLIYMNNELVHYFASEDDPPYSFTGQPGFNRITLRTRDTEYTLDSIRLEKGKKLELAIDVKRFENAKGPVKMTQRPINDKLSNQELYLLQKKTLALHVRQQGGEQYFWDDPTNIHAIRQWPNLRKPMLLVPFQAGANFNYVKRGELERKLLFESGFSYDIAESRERLYEWNSRERLQDDFNRKHPKVYPLGQLIYRPEDIKREAVPKLPTLYFSTSPQERISGKGRLQPVHTPDKPDSLSLLAFNLQSETGQEWLYPVYRNIIGGLEAGDYQLFLVRSDGQVIRKRFEIVPNETLVLDLAADTFVEDSLRQWPDRLFKLYHMPPQKPTQPEQRSDQIQENPYQGIGRLIQGQVTDDNGEPLIGATILVKGTTFGTVTDFDGYYSIWVPKDGAELVISYTGYSSQEIPAVEPGLNDVKLEADAMALQEVVVVGYGTQKRSNLTAAVTQISADDISGNAVQVLQGRAAGLVLSVPGVQNRVTIRGFGEPLADQPVIIINGKMSSLEALQLLDPNTIANLEILNGPEATALYGDRALNGVYVITLQSGIAIPTPEMDAPEPAGSLRDEFRDYAFWEPKLVTDRKGEAYFQATFPDNITAWNTYVLGMDRKQRAGIGLVRSQSWKSLTARLNVPRFLISGDTVDIVGQAVNYTQDTLSLATFFRRGEQELYRQEHQLNSSLTDTYSLAAPEIDSIELIYGLEHDLYQDGEKRHIPIFPPGSLETEGHFMVLHGDTTVNLSFNQDLPVNLFVADNALELLIEDLDYLKDYPHACMEQTASRLIALKLEQQIQQQLNQKFEEEQLVKRLIRKLEKAQLPDGSWGWWPGSRSSNWITRHIMEALQWAQEQSQPNEAVLKGIRFLVNTLSEMAPQDQLLTLDLLSGFDHQLDYDNYLNRLDSLKLPLHDRLLITRVRQRAGLPYQLDTLDKYRQETLFGAYHWGVSTPSFWTYRRYQHPVATTLIAYDLLKGAGREQEAQRARQYFLENRGIGQPNSGRAWYNTFETARVLAAILPDLLTEGQTYQENQVRVSGTVLDSLPYRGQIQVVRELQLQKTGTGPVYLTAYQQYHNDQPKPKTDIFEISSRLHQNERIVDSLEQGQVATLEVNLQNKVDAEYVMLEIPIPAACSYADRSINWRLEDHREYRREKVVIYCSRLPAGEHSFRVQLEARFNGRFTLNPARAEQMYFPVFFGLNGMKRVTVGDH